MNAYLDASVLSSLVLRDRGFDRISAWLRERTESQAISDFGIGEFTSAVAIRYRSGNADLPMAHAMLAGLEPLTAAWGRVLVTSVDIDDATDMVRQFDLGLRLPDAIHVALARRIAATLVTTDRGQQKAATALGISTVNPLQGYS